MLTNEIENELFSQEEIDAIRKERHPNQFDGLTEWYRFLCRRQLEKVHGKNEEDS